RYQGRRPVCRRPGVGLDSELRSKAMSSASEVIDTTVSGVGAEQARRGLDPDDRVTITIEPDELIPGRRASRARVIAAGLTEDDIDRMIKQAQSEVEPRAG